MFNWLNVTAFYRIKDTVPVCFVFKATNCNRQGLARLNPRLNQVQKLDFGLKIIDHQEKMSKYLQWWFLKILVRKSIWIELKAGSDCNSTGLYISLNSNLTNPFETLETQLLTNIIFIIRPRKSGRNQPQKSPKFTQNYPFEPEKMTQKPSTNPKINQILMFCNFEIKKWGKTKRGWQYSSPVAQADRTANNRTNKYRSAATRLFEIGAKQGSKTTHRCRLRKTKTKN